MQLSRKEIIAACLFNGSAVVQFDDLHDAPLAYGRDYAYFEAGDGTTPIIGEDHEARLVLVDHEERRQLDEWQAAETAVQVVALSERGRSLLWYEGVPIAVRAGDDAGRAETVAVRLAKRKKGASVHEVRNLLLQHGWTDADGDGEADGYNNGGTSFSFDGFSSGVQTLTSFGGSGTLTSYADVVLPAPGHTVTLCVDVSAVFSSASVQRIKVEALNHGGSGLGSATQSVTGTGTFAVSYTLPASTHTVRCWCLDASGVSSSDSYSYADPTLVVGTTTETLKF